MTTRNRLFIGIWSTGISYCDRWKGEFGDYKKLAFLPYNTLTIEVRPDCPPELLGKILEEAAPIIARRGERFPISGCGQYVVLGSK